MLTKEDRIRIDKAAEKSYREHMDREISQIAREMAAKYNEKDADRIFRERHSGGIKIRS